MPKLYAVLVPILMGMEILIHNLKQQPATCFKPRPNAPQTLLVLDVTY